tara:strand:+ start:237 stop:677 length:441 start_codon:yes stop_codon:yes gene_type:complete
MILEEIKIKLKEAMKIGDKNTVLSTRNMLEKIKKEQVDASHELKENEIIKIISKYAKQLTDSIEQFKKGDRLDLAEKEMQELNIVKSFLPEQMSELEIKKIVLHIIDELGANQITDMGKVMKATIEKTNGMADGKVISNIVRENLS